MIYAGPEFISRLYDKLGVRTTASNQGRHTASLDPCAVQKQQDVEVSEDCKGPSLASVRDNDDRDIVIAIDEG